MKKLSIAATIAFLFVIVFSVTAYAAPGDNGFAAILDNANAQIQSRIDSAVADANNALSELQEKTNSANLQVQQGTLTQYEADNRIRNYNAEFENLLNAISSRLLSETDGIVVNVLQEAQRRGIQVSVSYIEVNLAGHIYLVDPLRIIGN